MLVENTLLGEYNKIDKAIELLKTYEPLAIKNHPEGYYVASSFGKDSLAVIILCILAKVKFAVHVNHTTLDTPELVRFTRYMQKWLKENYNVDVYIHYPEESAWELISRKLFPPTRRARYCCDVLKEKGGVGRICITGVRWQESNSRAANRSMLEANAYTKKKIRLNNDNDEARKQFETCIKKGKHIINPIIAWSDEDVWELIKLEDFPYCELYDKGWDRLGCIGCPLSSNQEKELELYPKYKENYLRAFRRMAINRRKKGKTFWINPEDAEEIMEWWIHGTKKSNILDGQIEMELQQLEELEDE